jgi:hypothetical protein
MTRLAGVVAVAAAVLVLETGAADAREGGTKYGEGVSLAMATPVEELMSRPDAYLGKTVRVDGVVEAVCEKMGCWIELRDAQGGKGLRFKVEDGVIVFPVTARGRKASAEGEFVKVEVPVTADEHAAMHAVDGKTPAPEAGARPAMKVSYLVRATGAIVY